MTDRRADRREKFLQAGIEVIGSMGFQSSSVTDICAAAGLARTHFYKEFDNREQLLMSVYDLIQNDVLAAIERALRSTHNRDRRDIVAATMSACIDALGSDPRRARITYFEMVGVSDVVEEHRRKRRAVWATFIESTLRAEIGADFVPPGGHLLAATAYLGALSELVAEWSRTPPPRPPVDKLVETMIAVLGAFVPYVD